MRDTTEEPTERMPEFRPCAGPYPSMDMICILSEDESYRSDYFGPALSVLLHPYEDRIIGFNVSSVNFLARFARETYGHPKDAPLSLRTLTRLAALASWPVPIPVRHTKILEKIDAYFAEDRHQGLCLTREGWNSVITVKA